MGEAGVLRLKRATPKSNWLPSSNADALLKKPAAPLAQDVRGLKVVALVQSRKFVELISENGWFWKLMFIRLAVAGVESTPNWANMR